MAQLVERFVRNEQVAGSIPTISTKTKRTPFGAFLICDIAVARGGVVRPSAATVCANAQIPTILQNNILGLWRSCKRRLRERSEALRLVRKLALRFGVVPTTKCSAYPKFETA